LSKYVIPAQAGIQHADVSQTANGLHPGQQTKWHPLYRVTSDIHKRVWEHKNDVIEGFTKKYGVHRLVYYELHEDMVSAIKREKHNMDWRDLCEEIF
jgi:hypothetical protein